MRTESPRFDVAIVLVPRTPGDELFRLGQRAQPGEQATPLAKVEQALDALDRAFRPVSQVAQ